MKEYPPEVFTLLTPVIKAVEQGKDISIADARKILRDWDRVRTIE